MTTLINPPDSLAPPPPSAPKPEPVRIRPRSWSAADAGVLGGSALSAFALTWVVYFRLTLFSGGVGFVILWFVVFVTIFGLLASEIEGRLVATDKVVTVVIASGSLLLIVPLVLIVGLVVVKGIGALRPQFFTDTLASTGSLSAATDGGAAHAIVGTLEQVAIAALIAVPLGIVTAVYLNEVGGRLTRVVRMFIDAMSGLPSIVAGLFIYAVWVTTLDRGFSGMAAGLALGMLMLPTVTRAVEVVLRLVPAGLREASFALGAPQWRTTLRVVLPTARSGLVTAVILGMARAIGETAPLIMTSAGAFAMNWNPTEGQQDSLPYFVFRNYGSPQDAQVARAWTGALVLVFLVLVLFIIARTIGGRGVGATKRGWVRNRAGSIVVRRSR